MGRGGSEDNQSRGLRPTVDPAALLYSRRGADETPVPEPEAPLQAQSEQDAFELNFDNIDDVLRVNKKAKNRIELRGFLAQRDDLEALKNSLLEEREEAYGQMIQA